MDNIISTKKAFNLKDYFFEIYKRWYIPAVVIPLALILTFLGTKLFVTPMYKSSAMIYVLKEELSDITQSEVFVSTYLATDIVKIIEDKAVLEEVSNRLGNKYSYGEIKSFLKINHTEETRILDISVSAPSARDAKDIADAICDVSQEKLFEIMEVSRIRVVRYGDLPKAPHSPVLSKNIAVAFLVSVLAVLCAVFFIYITDTSVTSSSDVEKYLGLSVLATIPYSQKKTK